MAVRCAVAQAGRVEPVVLEALAEQRERRLGQAVLLGLLPQGHRRQGWRWQWPAVPVQGVARAWGRPRGAVPAVRV